MAFAPPGLPDVARALALFALKARMRLAPASPVWREIAAPSACAGALMHLEERALCADALLALDQPRTQLSVMRFLLARWYALSCDAALAHQAQHLSPTWAVHAVALDGSRPPDNSILVSVHHACHFLAFVRLATLLPQAAFVSSIDRHNRPNTIRAELLVGLLENTFGERIYRPESASRRCLDVLERGGSVIVVPDFFEPGAPMSLLGRAVRIGRGPVWLAERSRRPLVPFVVSPAGEAWRLWCGDPLEPTLAGLVLGLEQCIHHAPASWLGWRDWRVASAVV